MKKIRRNAKRQQRKYNKKLQEKRNNKKDLCSLPWLTFIDESGNSYPLSFSELEAYLNKEAAS